MVEPTKPEAGKGAGVEVLEEPEGLGALVRQILDETVQQNQYQIGRPRNDTEAAAICDRLAKSNAIPRAYVQRPGDIYAVMIAGQRFGFDVMQSMMAFCCINGAPRMWGDAAHAVFLVANRDRIAVFFERPPDKAYVAKEALCRVKFKDSPACHVLDDGGCEGEEIGAGCCVVRRFSHDDAQRAGLLDRNTPWGKYEGRMLQMRARSWTERDADPGCFRGFGIAEEVIEAAERRSRRYAQDLVRPLDAPPAKEKTPDEITKQLTGGTSAAAGKPAPVRPSAPPAQAAPEAAAEKVLVISSKEIKAASTFYAIVVELKSGATFEVTTREKKFHDLALKLKDSFALLSWKDVPKGDRTFHNIVTFEAAPEEPEAPPAESQEEPGAAG